MSFRAFLITINISHLPFDQESILRLLYLVSHPIQYQAPLLRKIAEQSDVELFVLFEHLETATAYHDPGFGQTVAWDVPLTEGYDHAGVKDRDHLKSEIEKSDVLWVHGWDTPLKRNAMKVAHLSGVKTLMRGENTEAAMPDGWGPKGMLKRWYLSRIFALCDGFLCIGSDNRDYYHNRGVGEDRLFSMSYTVDNDFFQTRVNEAALVQDTLCHELGISTSSPVILYAGKIQARKHPLTLLDAFKSLNQKEVGHPVLIYIGDGEQHAELEAAAKDMDEQVKILGFKNQTELPAYYELADIFVLAAEKEPWGLAVNEAMIGGCVPVVTSECGCARDLVDTSTGRIIAPDHSRDLANVLRDLLSDRGRLTEMGVAAKQRLDGWGLNESIAGLLDALKRISENRQTD